MTEKRKFTDHELTFAPEKRYDGENWVIATVDFGVEQFVITTDCVHASELSLGKPAADIALWAASTKLYDALERLVYCLENKIEPGPGTMQLARLALGDARGEHTQ